MNQQIVKGIIFDMDGTMFDSEKIWRNMWNHLPEAFGLENNLLVGEAMCGTSGEASLKVARRFFPELDPDEFVQEGLRQYHQLVFAKQPEEKPYLHELIRYLAEQGYVLAVASGSEQDEIELNLHRAGLTKYFTAAVSGHSVPCGKPAPDIFQETARQIGCRPEECMVIEDGENGIRAAAAAGCKPVMIPDLTQPSDEIKKLCAAVFDTMGDLLESLKKHNLFT